MRYPEGAPVETQALGGHSPGSLDTEWARDDLQKDTFFVVVPLFPGEASDGVEVGGFYDYWRPGYQLALAAVIRFFLVLTPDEEGALQTDHLPFALPGNVGLVVCRGLET